MRNWFGLILSGFSMGLFGTLTGNFCLEGIYVLALPFVLATILSTDSLIVYAKAINKKDKE